MSCKRWTRETDVWPFHSLKLFLAVDLCRLTWSTGSYAVAIMDAQCVHMNLAIDIRLDKGVESERVAM